MSVDGWAEVAFGAHYTKLYGHRDAGEAERAVALIARDLTLQGARVLDLGCGAGRHLDPLRRHGADAVGMDQSTSLLAEARGADTGSPLLRGDWGALPFRDASFDAVVSLFTAFGYGAHPEAQRTMIASVARVLRPGGSWVLDYLNPRRVRNELAPGPVSTQRRLDGWSVEETKSLVDDGRRVEKSVVIRPEGTASDPSVPSGGLDYRESVALIDRPELESLAAEAGMTLDRAHGDYDGSSWDPDTSPRWFLTFRKGGTS